MHPYQLTLVVIHTEDLQRTVHFYGQLGLKFVREQHGDGPQHYAATLPDGVFEIYPAAEPADVERRLRLGFQGPRVDDVTYTESEWGDRAVVRDPDGRAVELYGFALPTSTAAPDLVISALRTFEQHKRLAEGAVEQVCDEDLRRPLSQYTNSIAVIMKHVAGNLRSRWTDFLTADGEKSWRNRDHEFEDSYANRNEMLDDWHDGWRCLFEAMKQLTIEDLGKAVEIRGEPHSVPLAIERSLGHTCYHVGQIVQMARCYGGETWTTLTIPPGGSKAFNAQMQTRRETQRP